MSRILIEKESETNTEYVRNLLMAQSEGGLSSNSINSPKVDKKSSPDT